MLAFRRMMGKTRTFFNYISGFILQYYEGELGSSVSIVSDYRLDDRAIEVRFPAEAVSSKLSVQTASGAHPASYTIGTSGPFHGAKAQPRRDADHSPSCSVNVENI
jgi:hypothetical protein